MFALGQYSNNLAVLKRDRENGRLEVSEVFPVTTGPSFVAVMP